MITSYFIRQSKVHVPLEGLTSLYPLARETWVSVLRISSTDSEVSLVASKMRPLQIGDCHAIVMG